MSNATDNNLFGSILTANNEVRKRIDYIVDDIYIYFFRKLDLRIEALKGYENITI